jgi:hypothetical protein
MGMRLPLPAVAVALAGCVPPPEYSIRRSALAPTMAPAAYSGQPMAQPIELSFGSGSVVSLAPPEDGSAGRAGLYVPRVDLNGGLRGRVGDGSLAVLLDTGSSDGATAIAKDIPKPRQSTTGIGVEGTYSFGGEGPFRVGVALELLGYSVAWHQDTTCIAHCDGASVPPSEGSDTVAVMSLGLAPSYRLGRVVLFGSLTVRNHPTVDKSDVVATYLVPSTPEVKPGPWNAVIGGGVAVQLVGPLRGMVQLFMPVSGDPVIYAPTAAASLALGLGR